MPLQRESEDEEKMSRDEEELKKKHEGKNV
jgi:hypothetical protein